MKGHFSCGVLSISAVFISTVLSSCSHIGNLHTLSVLIGEGFVPNPKTVDVIPDTGAEVTVAGETLLKELGIQKSILNDNQQQLQHVAGGSLKVVGSCYLSFNLPWLYLH